MAENTINDGGLVFPVMDAGSTRADGLGLSVRDYFAAKAMPGLMGRDWSHHKGSDEELIAQWVRSSYAVADAMLKVRSA